MKLNMKKTMAEYGIQKPVFYRTHSFQIFASFVIFSTLLTAIYGFFIFRQMRELEKTIIRTKAQEFMVELSERGVLDHRDDNDGPDDGFITRYTGSEGIPQELSAQLDTRELTEPVTLFPNVTSGGKDLSVVYIKEPATSNTYYYVIDYDYFDQKFGKSRILRQALYKGWLFSVLLSIIIGFFNARRLIHPGKRLIEKVLKSNPENLPVDFSKEFKRDEIGVIASALEKSMLRIKAFIEREKQLTRDASHELRTPVTVIKGAVELMEELPEIKSPAVKRLTERIDRSVKDMEVLIEILLVRAREEASLKETATCHVEDVARQVIEESRYLIGRKPVELQFYAPASPRVNASEPELKMTLSNLVRNAINYTHQGHVAVTVQEDRVEIQDTGVGIDSAIIDKITTPYVKGEDSKGYGIGLSIVSRICGKYGWKLRIHSGQGETSFKIIFNG